MIGSENFFRASDYKVSCRLSSDELGQFDKQRGHFILGRAIGLLNAVAAPGVPIVMQGGGKSGRYMARTSTPSRGVDQTVHLSRQSFCSRSQSTFAMKPLENGQRVYLQNMVASHVSCEMRSRYLSSLTNAELRDAFCQICRISFGTLPP